MARAERRAVLRDLLKEYARGGFNPGNTATAFGLVRDLTDILTDTKNAKRASDAGTLMLTVYESATGKYGYKGELACKKGCDYCCRTRVTASALEIFSLSRAVRKRWADPSDPLKARFEAAEAITRHQPLEQRNREHAPCPMLFESACSQYTGRPLACRAFSSRFVQACIDAYNMVSDAIPKPKQNQFIRDMIVGASKAALQEAKLPEDSFELGHALHVTLTQENAESAWLAGTNVFEGVARDIRQEQARPLDDGDLMVSVLRAGAFGRDLPQNPWFQWPA